MPPPRQVVPAFAGPDLPDAALVADCVHCGFCLPACPTYQLWGEEMDSPRGRIHLVGQALGGGPLDAATVGHLDACLGCMACMTACPSGVRYDRILESARAQVERRWRRSLADRARRAAIFATFSHPRRLRLLRGPLRAWQGTRLRSPVRAVLARVAPTLAAMEALAPPVPATRPDVAALTPASGPRRGRVALVLGCVQREYFPEVGAATARLLAAEGFDVVAPPAQGCCGALSAHAGRLDEARRLGRRLAGVLRATGADHVVVDAAGCGSTLKELGELLPGDPHAAALAAGVRDVAELLDEVGTTATYHPLPVEVAYHDACHLAHAQGVRSAPRRLLAAVPGLRVAEVADPGTCCGSAGVYNLLHPGPAAELGDRKAAAVAATGAEVLVSANPGCLLQVGAALRRAGVELAAVHTVQVLDASVRAASPAALGLHPPRRPPQLSLRPLDPDTAADVAAGRRQAGWADDYPSEGDRVVARLLLERSPAPPPPWVHHLVVEAGPGRGTVVGGIGFHGPPVDGEVEVGYGIVASRRGAGYAREALRQLLEVAWSGGARAVRAETEPGNAASRAVLRACGFDLVGEDGERARYRLGRPGTQASSQPPTAS